jgi:dihydropteroate synthase
MGILNATPDSFSDGGVFSSPEAFPGRIAALLDEGAAIIDIGGESTRPGSAAVSEDDQIERVLGPVRLAASLAGPRGALVSIDTTSPRVARAALAAGASLVNDVSCLADVGLAEAAREAGAALVIMHSRGPMGSMAGYSSYPQAGYTDVVAEVRAELGAARARALAAGLGAGEILVDPGLGFHKSAEHSYALLGGLGALAGLGAVVVGASRKSFLASEVAAPPAGRLGGSVAAALIAAGRGAAILRVHDVRATSQALAVDRAARAAGGGLRGLFEGLLHLFSRRPAGSMLRDALDIAIVAYVLYRALLVLRGTRAQQVAVGLVVIAGVYVAARWAGLVTLVSLMDMVLSSAVLVLVVVFQNDIRRGLMRVGDRAWLPGLARSRETELIDEVVAAATELARHRMGALIAFEQNATLDEFVVGHGIAMDAVISRELLVTIFQPESVNKLHDGAVIVRSLRLASAGVFFPMPEGRHNLDSSLGSRHRAALGVTEETDAVVVVVSEERGSITVCYHGNMIQHLDGQKLKAVLLDLLGYKQPRKKADERPRLTQAPPPPPAPPPAGSSPSLPSIGTPSLPSIGTPSLPSIGSPSLPAITPLGSPSLAAVSPLPLAPSSLTHTPAMPLTTDMPVAPRASMPPGPLRSDD